MPAHSVEDVSMHWPLLLQHAPLPALEYTPRVYQFWSVLPERRSQYIWPPLSVTNGMIGAADELDAPGPGPVPAPVVVPLSQPWMTLVKFAGMWFTQSTAENTAISPAKFENFALMANEPVDAGVNVYQTAR
jgi:hypothetical protein